MKIKVIEGRTFEPQDDNDSAQRVVMVNQALAKRFWQGSPIGRRVNPGFANPKVWATIVGVVEDTKNAGMDKPAAPELYLPAKQVSQFGLSTNMNFVVRTTGNPESIAGREYHQPGQRRDFHSTGHGQNRCKPQRC